MELITRLVHGDVEARDPGAITPAIAQATNQASASASTLAVAVDEAMHPGVYNRHGNQNHEQVSTIIADLEGAERAVMTASGMGALTTALLSFVKAGDHVVGQRSMYGGTTGMLTSMLPHLGVECTTVDQGGIEAFEHAVRPNTRLLLVETPSNPRLEITDLRAVAALARARGIRTLADNTFATPLNQRPLDHGIDLVWHSATKYLGGHADLMAGVVAGSSRDVERVWATAQTVGAVLSPFNAWLLLRGLRTLSLRMERHNENGLAVAEALVAHAEVKHVHYPGLASHPGHDVARSQMDGFGGVVSIEFKAGFEAANRFIGGLQLARRAASLGDVGSLVVHPAALWAGVMPPAELDAAGVVPGLVRLACGIEHHNDLVDDVVRAADRSTADSTS